MAKDLLLEIGTEEIPARFMPDILAQLEKNTKQKLADMRIGYTAVQALGTPRRMTVLITDLADMQENKQSENKGPSVKIAFDANGAPTKAAQGFARGQGVDVAELVQKDGYIYAVVNEVGRAVRELLPDFLLDLIHGLNFPKNMRWSNYDIRFVRPIRWLLALHGTEVVPLEIADVASSNFTFGHRFLSKGKIEIASPAEYVAKLKDNHVIVDPNERRELIRAQIHQIAVEHGGTAEIDAELLEEVVYLVEYPTALYGSFADSYLSLPPESIITPMREHQRYFPLFSKEGQLLPVFITVRNGGSAHLDIVRHGNERVLRARLDDAKFFFEEDQKVPLAARVEKLQTIIFQEGLGTLLDKTKRIQQLAGRLAKQFALDAKTEQVIARGAELAKTDLLTGMVYEFTELQGIMGRKYALLNGEDPLVAEAIFEHYLPRFAGDILPATAAGSLISIADKIDNIVATFSRGLIPTGSQDPYALRRQALGIVNILIRSQYNLSLAKLLDDSMDLLALPADKRAQLQVDIQEFFRLRIKNVLSDAGIRYDLIDAVMEAGIDDVYEVWLRANALAAQAAEPAMTGTVQAFTRIINLTKKDSSAGSISASLFANEAESALYAAYQQAESTVTAAIAAKDYAAALTSMTALAAPIDAFFSAVMVMVEDQAVRNNRVALLKAIAGLATPIADISKVLSV